VSLMPDVIILHVLVLHLSIQGMKSLILSVNVFINHLIDVIVIYVREKIKTY